jgi:cytochrome c-type biogenesis protein CcmH
MGMTMPEGAGTKPGFRLSRGALMLGAAALMLAAAAGYRLWSDGGGAPQTAPTAPITGDDALSALEARVKAEPENPDAWQQLGAARFDAGDFGAAVTAFEKATSLAGDVAGLWSALGEARVMASRDEPMPPAALDAFRRAAQIDPKDPRARYFLAVQQDLTGDHKGAIDAWFALLADTPPGAPWEPDLRRTIEEVGKINGIDVAARLAATKGTPLPPESMPVAAQGIPGPSRADMEAASQLPKGQQDAMISGMVDGLEAKLAADPKQPDRWIMLMRSRMTLGESAKAADALRRATAANPGEAARIRAEARLLGVPGA